MIRRKSKINYYKLVPLEILLHGFVALLVTKPIAGGVMPTNVAIKELGFGGSGCPQSGETTLKVKSLNELSWESKNLKVEATASPKSRKSKRMFCQITWNLEHDKNFIYRIEKIAASVSVDIPKDQSLKITASLYGQGNQDSAQKAPKDASSTITISGPKTGVVPIELPSSQTTYNRCNAIVTNNSKIEMVLESLNSGEATIIEPITIYLAWSPCMP